MRLLLCLLIGGMAWGQNGTSYSFNNPPPDAVTSGTAIVVGDTGTTSWSYWVVAKYAGGDSAPFGPLTVSNGRPLGQMGVYRYVSLIWTAQSLATSYDVLRTATPTRPTGSCACVISSAQVATTLNDTGLSTSAYTVSNPTGKYATIYLDSLSSSTPKLKQNLNGSVSDIGSGTGGAYTAGASGAITITGSTIDVDTAYVPNKAGATTVTGPWTFAGATSTAPMKVGTSDPATCTVGDFLFRSDTSTTKACTATNTWTAVGGGGGGAVVRTTYASLPACGAGNTNYQYVLTDSIYSANCNGSSYAYWAGKKYIPTLPWANGTAYGAGATATATTGSVLYDGGSPSGGDAIRAFVKAVPAAPYTVILDIDHSAMGAAQNHCGMILTEGTTIGTHKAILLGFGVTALRMTKFNVNSGWNSDYFNYSQGVARGNISIKMVDDNTNRTWFISPDRINWQQVQQHLRTDFITATHYGYGCNMDGVSGFAGMTVEGLYAQ